MSLSAIFHRIFLALSLFSFCVSSYAQNFGDDVQLSPPSCSENTGDPLCMPDPQPSREEILSKESALDTADSAPNNLSSEHEAKRAIIKMKLIQTFQRHPDTYWAFEFAARGHYDHFENSKKAERITRDALRIMSNIGFSIRGIQIDIPDLTEIETIQNFQKETIFSNIKPEDENIVSRAEQITDLYLSCSQSGFDCDHFHNLFSNKNFDSKKLTQSLDKALSYTQTQAPESALSKNLEFLEASHPTEAQFVQSLQENKDNPDKLKEIMKENVKLQYEKKIMQVGHIKQSDPFYAEKDAIALNLEHKEKFYSDELAEINQQIESLGRYANPEESQKLNKEKQKHIETLDRINTAKKLHEFQKFSNDALAWTQAVTAVAHTLNMPEEVVKLGEASTIGFKMLKAAGSMLINGALDPTGITVILNGISLIGNILSNAPSPEEIIYDKLKEIVKNQEKMLADLDVIKKQNQKILSQVTKAIRLMGNNHTNIQNQLAQIRTDMKFYFHAILQGQEKQKYESLIESAYAFKQALSDLPYKSDVCNDGPCPSAISTDEEGLISDTKILLSKMYKALEHIAAPDQPMEFHQFSKSDIEKFLKDPSIENRLPFLFSMIEWLNETELRFRGENPFTGFSQNTYKFVGRLENEDMFNQLQNILADKNIINPQIGLLTIKIAYPAPIQRENNLLNYAVQSKIIYGDPIPLDNMNKNITYPSYQDELLSHYVELAQFIPSKEDHFGQVIKDKQLEGMCRQASSIQNISKILRQHIQKAWAIYQIYSQILLFEAKHFLGFRDFYFPNDRQKAEFIVGPFKRILHRKFPAIKKQLKEGEKAKNEYQLIKALNKKSNPSVWNHSYFKNSGVSLNQLMPEISRYKIGRNEMYGQPVLEQAIFLNNMNLLYDIDLKMSDFFKHLYPLFIDHFLTTTLQHDKKAHNDIIEYGYYIKDSEESCVTHTFLTQNRVNIFNLNEHDEMKAINQFRNQLRKQGYKTAHSGGTFYTEISPLYNTSDPKHFQYCMKELIFKPDIETFIATHTQTWDWLPATIYNDVISHLNNYGLILEWMKARLAFDTIVKTAYGPALSYHPDLAFLDILMTHLPSEMEPFIQPHQKLSSSDQQKIINFFKSIEIIPKIDHLRILQDYANGVSNFINKKAGDSQTHFTDFISPNPWTSYWKIKRRDLMLSWGRDNIPTPLPERFWHINDRTYLSADGPLKEPKEFSEAFDRVFDPMLPNGDLSLMYHLPLPPESVWKDYADSVGLGLPKLRKKALQKASMYDNLRPENCSIQ